MKKYVRENQKEASNKINGEAPQRTALCFHAEETLVQPASRIVPGCTQNTKGDCTCMILGIMRAPSLAKTPQWSRVFFCPADRQFRKYWSYSRVPQGCDNGNATSKHYTAWSLTPAAYMGCHTNMYSFTPWIYTHRLIAENLTLPCPKDTKNIYKYYISIQNLRQIQI